MVQQIERKTAELDNSGRAGGGPLLNMEPLWSHCPLLTTHETARLLIGFHHERVPSLTLMSQTRATPASNFQVVFNNALRTYEKHTKNDLLSHPLAAQLQTCDSPSAILDLLHQQVQELNQSRNSHQRLTKWLHPTVNVLYSFSGTLGEGVSLVCFKTVIQLKCEF